jgi:hypothetical protein
MNTKQISLLCCKRLLSRVSRILFTLGISTLTLLTLTAETPAKPAEVTPIELLYRDLTTAGWNTSGIVTKEITALAREHIVVDPKHGGPHYMLYFMNGSLELDSTFKELLSQRLTSAKTMEDYADTFAQDPRIRKHISDVLLDGRSSVMTLTKDQLVLRYGQPSNLRGRKLKDMHFVEYWYTVSSNGQQVVNCVIFKFNGKAKYASEIELDVREGERLTSWLKWPSVGLKLSDLPVVITD